MFSIRMSVRQQSVLWVTSSVLWHVRVRSAGTTYFSENYFKAMFSFHWISVLLISATFQTYLANIVFGATWPLIKHRQLSILWIKFTRTKVRLRHY